MGDGSEAWSTPPPGYCASQTWIHIAIPPTTNAVTFAAINLNAFFKAEAGTNATGFGRQVWWGDGNGARGTHEPIVSTGDVVTFWFSDAENAPRRIVGYAFRRNGALEAWRWGGAGWPHAFSVYEGKVALAPTPADHFEALRVLAQDC